MQSKDTPSFSDKNIIQEMHVPRQECNLLPAWACSQRNFGSFGDPDYGMKLQLPHEALSGYLVVDDVAHPKFDASSSPKEKRRTLLGLEEEGAKTNHHVYSSIDREIVRHDNLVAVI
mgnify:FL=1